MKFKGRETQKLNPLPSTLCQNTHHHPLVIMVSDVLFLACFKIYIGQQKHTF